MNCHFLEVFEDNMDKIKWKQETKAESLIKTILAKVNSEIF